MTAKLYWQSSDRVIYMEWTGKIKIDSLQQRIQAITRAMDADEQRNRHKVHVVIGAERVTGLPKSVSALRSAFAPMLVHPRLGWCVVVTNHLVVQATLSRIASTNGLKWRTVNSFAAATELLRRADSTLTQLSVSYPATGALPVA